uniref:Uncharacterized protein n=1 Tax=Oryza glumipatula TaxID=40148 RepID=A0A0E0B9Y5_9ORYZ
MQAKVGIVVREGEVGETVNQLAATALVVGLHDKSFLYSPPPRRRLASASRRPTTPASCAGVEGPRGGEIDDGSRPRRGPRGGGTPRTNGAAARRDQAGMRGTTTPTRRRGSRRTGEWYTVAEAERWRWRRSKGRSGGAWRRLPYGTGEVGPPPLPAAGARHSSLAGRE